MAFHGIIQLMRELALTGLLLWSRRIIYTPLGYGSNDNNSLKGAALVDCTPGTETLEVYLEYKLYVEKRQRR
jgi:hypothetical protein